jgi:hypothetical protein
VFFLDADDELTEGALRDLISFAEANGSEVVLAKMGGLGGRIPPRVVFAKTIAHADIVRDSVFNTMGPWKLYDRDLIERTALRFPEDLRRGEDPPFVATAYLNARHISVLAEREYYLIRDREDGSNLTRSGTDPVESVARMRALVDAIIGNTSPGTLRDVTMKRPLSMNLPRVLDRKLPELDVSAQDGVLQALRDCLHDHLTAGMYAHLEVPEQIKLALAMQNRREDLIEMIRWQQEKHRSITFDGAEFRQALPPVARDVEVPSPRSVRPAAEAQLTAIETDGNRLTFKGIALTKDSDTSAHGVLLRLKNRDSENEIDVPATRLRAADLAAGQGAAFVVDIDTADLPLGLWDVFVVQTFGDIELTKRLGSDHPDGFSTAPRYLPGRDDPEGVVYFTRGPGNVSLDLGFTLRANQLPDVVVTALLPAADWPQAVVETNSPRDVEIVATSEGATVPLHTRELSPGLLLLSVDPETVSPGTALELSAHREGIEAPLRMARGLTSVESPASPGFAFAVDDESTLRVIGTAGVAGTEHENPHATTSEDVSDTSETNRGFWSRLTGR